MSHFVLYNKPVINVEGLPTLLTNVKHYTGTPDALVVAATDVGWASSTDLVRISPNGRYAVGTLSGSPGAHRFQFFKFSTTTLTWSALSAPASLPSIGPVAMEWSPDGTYLACAVAASSPDNLFVYKLAGDTLTKLADPVDTLPNIGLGIAWDTASARLAVGNGSSAAGVYVWDFVGDVLTNRRTAATNATIGSVSRMVFEAGSGSRYLLCGNASAVAVIDTTTNPMVVRTAVAEGASSSVHWDASGAYAITVANSGANPVAVYDFDNTLGSEALTFNNHPADQPSGTPREARSTYGRRYMALAHAASQIPLVYDLATAPILVKETDAAAAGAGIGSIDWSNV